VDGDALGVLAQDAHIHDAATTAPATASHPNPFFRFAILRLLVFSNIRTARPTAADGRYFSMQAPPSPAIGIPDARKSAWPAK
jgi:hypothetical protein